ncbi:hypothetical protein ERO13_A03G149300v2 [Gossypium hirsutum]|nr:hypothetical protein ERO13_A03G149300v2 [Gossypium hirsutum]
MRIEASAAFTSSRPLFPLFIFLFFIPGFHSRNLQQCSSSCGDLTNISSPFRLQGDPAGCGGKYYVKGISYDKRTVRVVDVNLAHGTCGLPYKSLSMSEATEDGRFPSLITFWQANFVNCSNTIPELRDSKVPCLSGDTSHVYVNFSNRNLFGYEIPRSCKVISRIPTSWENELNYPYNETTLKLLATGFDLRWSVECRNCHTSGLFCVYKSNNDPRIFQCETVFEEDYKTLLPAFIAYLVSRSLIDMALLVRLILAPLVVFVFLLHKCLTTRKTVGNAEHVGDIQMLPEPVPCSPQGHTSNLPSDSPKQVLIATSIERSA